MRDCNYNLTNVVLRVAGNRAYYFDESGIYRSIPINEVAGNKKIKVHLVDVFGKECWDRFANLSLIFGNLNQRSLEMIITRFPEGETIEKFYKELENVKTNKRITKPQGLERFITKIQRPIFSRATGNFEKNTFDFVVIEANIVASWKKDRMQYIYENQTKIKDMVISKLKNDRTFQKYGVPINFLKLSKITVSTRFNYIQFIFELKEF